MKTFSKMFEAMLSKQTTPTWGGQGAPTSWHGWDPRGADVTGWHGWDPRGADVTEWHGWDPRG
ncbi:MAG TPA: hypothetical protein P5181_12100 [Dermatophilaceae bacterium]|nr:hypothetical protein [Dermatophilaceae bacterium]